MTQAILPGATLGVLGSGQLGRMFAIAARQLGYGIQVYSPDGYSPAGQIADREWTGGWEETARLKEFAQRVQVVTLEFENVPVATIQQLQEWVPVRPGPAVLEAAQNRLLEKTAIRQCGLPTAEFVAVNSLEELHTHLSAFGGSGILKTASWGYDGKGQKRIDSGDSLTDLWQTFSSQTAILEQLVDFQFELSVIAVRNVQGEIDCYDPILNRHRNHILDVSVSGAPEITPKIAADACEIARTVMTKLDVVGVLCVELFLTGDGRLLVNEIAPRPHNSGHLTIDAHVTSQFEQQVRAICGLPLGDTGLAARRAQMHNLIGADANDWQAILSDPANHLHLYGKHEARPGRKMGHVTRLTL